MKDVDLRINYGLSVGQKHGFIKPLDTVVLVTGWKKGSGHTNNMRIITVPETLDESAHLLPTP